jgi:hypothetical protein
MRYSLAKTGEPPHRADRQWRASILAAAHDESASSAA